MLKTFVLGFAAGYLLRCQCPALHGGGEGRFARMAK